MATINNIKKRADEIKNAYEPESVTAEDVGGVVYDLAEVSEQQAMALSDTAEGTDLALRRSDALQETLVGIGAEGGTVQNAAAVALAGGTGLVATDVQQGIKELATAIFPVTASIYEGNAGTFETGDQIVPLLKLDIKRNGVNVQSSSTVSVNPPEDMEVTTASNRKVITYTGEPLTSGTHTFAIDVVQGGQHAAPLTAEFKFCPYLYKEVVEANQKPTASTIKAFIEGSWRNSNKVLSNDKTLVSTPLASGKYYLFAVRQTAQGSPVTLIVKNASSGGTIDVPNTDKGNDLAIARVNGSGSDYYSWVIVPASPNSWTFKITNS